MGSVDAAFAPLVPGETAAAPEAARREKDDWRPILPAPADGVPPHPPRHRRHGAPSAVWSYFDSAGRLLFLVCRFDLPDGDKEVLPYCYGDMSGRVGWHWKAPERPRPLYGLDRLAAQPDAPVVLCEGEKAADAAGNIFPDHVAVTSQGGCKAAKLADWSTLAGRRVVIWPDNDIAGMGYAADATAELRQAGAASVRVVEILAGWPDGWDLADPTPEGITVDLRAMLDAAGEAAAGPPDGKAGNGFLLMLEAAKGKRPGVYKFKEWNDKTHGPMTNWEWVCSPLEIAAATRSAAGDDWGRLLTITDRDGGRKEWAMPAAMLAGDGAGYRERLLSLGLEMAPARFARDALHEYISTSPIDARARCVSRIGWHDAGGRSVYVLPDATFGDAAGERILLQSTGTSAHAFKVSGTIEEWRDELAAACVGNSRLVLAVSAAFAAPLLRIAGEESGGINFQGASRAGKSTTLRAAASVWGGGGVGGYVRTWRATGNGLEGIAEAHCDALLCLDEMGQVDGREAGEIAYMLANGAGKGRAARDGSARRSAEWRLLFLSTGELSLADKMSESGKRPRAGQEIRLVDVPADAGAGMGMFEHLHGVASAEAFSRHLKETTDRRYGSPIRAFLNGLIALPCGLDTVGERIADGRRDFLARNGLAGANGQVLSVAGRFALIEAAGDLATALGITGWSEDEAQRAADVCFQAWLAKRGTMGDRESEAGIAQVRAFIEANGGARFETIGGGIDGAATDPRTVNRAGFKRKDAGGNWEYLILPEAWKAEVCKGLDPNAVAKAMKARGYLRGDGDRTTVVRDVPGHGNKVRLYCVTAAIMQSGEGGQHGKPVF